MGKKLKGDPHSLKRYQDWHWGNKASRVWEVDDPDLPDQLTECGKLEEIGIDIGERKPALIEFPGVPGNVLTFDSYTDLLYIVLSSGTRKKLRARYWVEDERFIYRARVVAKATGGENQGGIPEGLKVQAIGPMDHIVYRTHKKGDRPAEYIHHFGEEGGIRPCLAIDKQGRLWILGGDYTNPDEGITD